MSIELAYSNGRRAKGQCEPVVFWARSDGDLMLAPHTDMPCLPGYQRIECTTPSAIEKMSRKMAAIEENKMRGLKVEEQLRALPKWEQIVTNCKLRLAKGCVSKMDEAMTQSTLERVEKKIALFRTLLVGDLMLTEGALEIERTSTKVGMAQFGGKKVTL